MKLKAIMGIALTTVLLSMLTIAFNIQIVASTEQLEIQWARRYGGTNDDQLICIIQTSDGGYAMAGYTKSFGVGDSDGWVIKIGLRYAVGGIWLPVDKFGLLAPYIGLASTILVAAVATSIYGRHVKRKKEK